MGGKISRPDGNGVNGGKKVDVGFTVAVGVSSLVGSVMKVFVAIGWIRLTQPVSQIPLSAIMRKIAKIFFIFELPF